MQAIARRARDLQSITDRQFRYLMQQMSMKGWRTSEPEFGPIKQERPRAIRKLIEVAFGAKATPQEMAKEFNLSTSFMIDLLEMSSPPPGNQIMPKKQDRESTLRFFPNKGSATLT